MVATAAGWLAAAGELLSMRASFLASQGAPAAISYLAARAEQSALRMGIF